MTDAHRRTLDQLATAVAIFAADQRLDLLQRRLSRAVGPRAGVPRSEPDRLRRARPAARRAQAARAGGFPQLEDRAARGLSRDRAARARVASARRPHAARRHHAQSGGRRHLSVRRRDRAARAGAALRRADPRAGRDARQPRRRRRGVRQRRAAAPAQSGLRDAVAARAAATLAERAPAHRGRDRLVPAALRRRRVLGDSCAAPSPALEGRAPVSGAARAPRRQRARLRHRAAARRRDAGHLPGRHRHGQCRARADRAQRGAGGRRPRSRTTSSTTSPTSCARRSPTSSASRSCSRDPTIGPLTDKQREYLGYINTSTKRAARDHQRHPRSRHHRRRRDDARPRRGRHPRRPSMPRPRACRTGSPRRTHPARHRAPRPTSAASSPTSGACARSCSICLSNAVGFSPAGATVTLSAERRDGAVVFTRRPTTAPAFRPRCSDRVFDRFETPRARLAPSRRRPRPFDRALLRRAAWRYGEARFRRRPRHHRHLHLPARAARRAATAAERHSQRRSA